MRLKYKGDGKATLTKNLQAGKGSPFLAKARSRRFVVKIFRRIPMRRFLPLLLVLVANSVLAFARENSPPKPSGDSQSIEQLEADLLQAEMTTDPAAIDRIFADDWVSLTPNGTGPSKAAILERYRQDAGQAQPYTAKQQSMQVFRWGDTAVAAYVKVYTAKENNNIAHQDTTDIFIKSNGVWKLRLTRTSPHANE